jgi:hypothetical protein
VVFVSTVYTSTCISAIHKAAFCLTQLDSVYPIINNLHFMNHKTLTSISSTHFPRSLHAVFLFVCHCSTVLTSTFPVLHCNGSLQTRKYSNLNILLQLPVIHYILLVSHYALLTQYGTASSYSLSQEMTCFYELWKFITVSVKV